MVKCRYCGTSNPKGSVYCNHCGGAFAAAPAGNASGAAKATSAAASASAVVRTPPQAATATATPTPPRSPNATGTLPPQTQLNGRYIVLATVGQGGMAAVYRGLDTKTHRQVAIKEMSQDGLTPDELTEALASFQAEADMLQRLRHPNLPRVWERFSDGVRHYLVMEFVEGQTLEQRQQAANGKPLPEVEVMRYAQQICSVLAYLHSQRPPIIFRDLKPANVMVTPQGQVKLIDFGIARVFHPGRTKDTQVLGTPGFAPPEQYGKAQTDARADIYALGVTLYQLLTAYDPTSTPFTLPPANTRNASILPHVQAALEKATKLNRDERYASVAAFEHDLLHPDGFVFRNGQRARTVPELVALCRSYPQEAQDHLYTGRFEGWLRAIGQSDVARAAAVVVSAGGDRGAGLAAFMAQATRPARPTGGARAAAPRGGTQARQGAQARTTQAPQGAQTWAAGIMGRVAAHTARRFMAQAAAAAATAVGTQILIEVRPRSANFGALMAGQRGRLALLVSGQYGLPVTGRIVPLAPWLKVDQSAFAGPTTNVQLTVDTSQLPRAGTYTTNLQISSGTQQLYVPVSVEVLATRVPNPPPAAPRRAAKPRGTKHGQSQSTPEWVKLLLSWLTALGTAGWGANLLVQAFRSGALRVPSGFPLSAQLTQTLALLLAMVLLAAPASLIGRWGPHPLGRLASALIAATIGVALAWVLAQNGPLAGNPWPGMVAGTHPPLALALVGLGLLGASAGAAIGVAPSYSKRILAVVRFVVRHRSTVLVLGSVALGGWLGFMLLHPFFSGLLAPFGMIVGIVLAIVLAARINRATRMAHRMPGRP